MRSPELRLPGQMLDVEQATCWSLDGLVWCWDHFKCLLFRKSLFLNETQAEPLRGHGDNSSVTAPCPAVHLPTLLTATGPHSCFRVSAMRSMPTIRGSSAVKLGNINLKPYVSWPKPLPHQLPSSTEGPGAHACKGGFQDGTCGTVVHRRPRHTVFLYTPAAFPSAYLGPRCHGGLKRPPVLPPCNSGSVHGVHHMVPAPAT